MKIGFFLKKETDFKYVSNFIKECQEGQYETIVFTPAATNCCGEEYIYENINQVQNYILDYIVDAVYQLRLDLADKHLFRVCENWIHTVSPQTEHGRVCLVSKWAQISNNSKLKVVHIIMPQIPLQMPTEEFIIGIMDEFDYVNARLAIVDFLKENSTVKFLCIGQKWIDNPRIQFVESIDPEKCNALVYGSTNGYTFWVPECGSNMPRVIIYENARNKEHTRLVGEKGLYYYDRHSLLDVLKNLKKGEINIPQPDSSGFIKNFQS